MKFDVKQDLTALNQLLTAGGEAKKFQQFALPPSADNCEEGELLDWFMVTFRGLFDRSALICVGSKLRKEVPC